MTAEALDRTSFAQDEPVKPPAKPIAARLPLPTRLVRAQVLRRLGGLALPLELWEDGVLTLPAPGHAAPIRIDVRDRRFWAAVAFDGTDGAGDAWTEGWWTTDDLTGLVRLLARYEDRLRQVDRGIARVAMPVFRLAHVLRRNTRAGARANIHAHYDLGNAFFRAWLDPSLTYSSALYSEPGMSLAAAQQAKIARLLDRLELKPGERLVEIGTGWGELALRAAERGAHVTTVTISTEQHALAQERVRAAGLAHLVDVRLCDYRDLDGTYDKLVSVEMVEAVGREFHGTWFASLSRLLKPGGLAVVQAITIRDQVFHRAAREVDFIKRRIFPGCCIPSVEALLTAMRRSSDLTLVAMEDFAAHYARTLEEWRASFRIRAGELRAMGYDDRFQRLWDFYLAYCAGGFAERALGVSHLVFAKPAWRAADHGRIIGAARWDA